MKLSKPNIILIVLDTHRADRLGIYGYPHDTSPNIDAFAQISTVYENAIAPAQWTIPSHASMFCGEYPTTHGTLQSGDALNVGFHTFAEHLLRVGYQTTGFCNNPLVGVLDNGFRRGFQRFYNYGGTVPSTPFMFGEKTSGTFSKIRQQYFRIIDRIATPIQQAVAASPKVLQIALNPWLVPLWTRYSNFKGDTESSINDTCHHLLNKMRGSTHEPKFIFLNLMETHLPYTPPKRFIQKFAPLVLEDPDAQEFIRVYNTQALKWLLPLEKPYPELEARTLDTMYDAEVSFQDHLLNQLFEILDQPQHRENSLVIIVADHGEMLGEHQIMGHGLGVYEELVHIPLMIRFPGQEKGIRVKPVVSTVNLFHTILESAGIDTIETIDGENLSPQNHSLSSQMNRSDPVFSEAYAPFNLIMILEKYAPSLLEDFDCGATRWAVYDQSHKLIRVENLNDALYDYMNDPQEQHDLYASITDHTGLADKLDQFLNLARSKGRRNHQDAAGDIEDPKLQERLRKLGYIE